MKTLLVAFLTAGILLAPTTAQGGEPEPIGPGPRSLAAAQRIVEPAPEPWTPPKMSDLRDKGFSIVSVTIGMTGPVATLTQGSETYLCALEAYEYTATKEQFLKGGDCISMQ